jgi:Ca2+-binding RTX toxin-like protein
MADTNQSSDSDSFKIAWSNFFDSAGLELTKKLLGRPIPGIGESINEITDKIDILAPIRDASLRVFEKQAAKISDLTLTAQEFGIALLNELGITNDGNTGTPDAFVYKNRTDEPVPVFGSDLYLGLALTIKNGTIGAGSNWGLDFDFAVSGEFDVPIDAKFGMPELLEFKSDGSFSIGAEAGLKASIGADDNGFFFDTGKDAQNKNKSEASIGLVANLNGASGIAALPLLNLQAKDNTTTGNDFEISYVGAFQDRDTDKLLSLDEITSLDFDYNDRFDIVADLDLGLQYAAFSFLPAISTDFKLDWSLDEGKEPTITFDNISIDISELFGRNGLVYDVFQKLKGIVDFSKSFTDALTTEINDLKEIGAPYTILQLAESTGAINQSTRQFIEWLAQFNKFVDAMAFSSSGIVSLGSISLADAAKVWGDSFDPTKAQVVETQAAFKDALEKQGWDESSKFEDFAQASADFSSGKFSLPVIENPLSFVGNLLLGKPSDVFTFETPKMDLSAGFGVNFPIYGPITARLAGMVGVSAQLAGGYDTYGLWETLKGYYNGEDIGWSTVKAIDGLYLDSNLTKASLTTAAELSGGLNVGGVSVLTGGGLYGNATFGLSDPNQDGKLRPGESLDLVFGDAFDPFALLNPSGKLSFEGFVEGRIEWAWASMRKRYVFYTKEILNFENGELSTFAPLADPQVLASASSTAPGGEGDDTFEIVGAEMDAINGGSGLDIVSYAPVLSPVFLNLATGTHAGAAATGDVFTNIEQFEGTQNDDTMVAGSQGIIFKGLGGNDSLYGGAGDDIFEGGAGADTIDGQGGRDFAIYMESTEAVAVNLSARTAAGGDATGDTLISIDNLVGSELEDTLTGSKTANYIFGYRGNDFLYGAEGDDSLEGGRGADFIEGGSGSDFVTYDHSFAGVSVNLSTSSLSGGHADGDTLIGIDNLAGSAYNDILIGDSVSNVIIGELGDDQLQGAAGSDSILGGLGNDTLYGDLGNDSLYGSSGSNLLDGGLGNDLLVSESSTDTLRGGAGNDVYRISSAGVLILEDAEGGFDTIYSTVALSSLPFGIEEIVVEASPGAVPAVLQTSRTVDRMSEGLRELRLMGSANINANGNSGANAIYGNSGANALVGDLGSDFISGGEGTDTLTGCSTTSGRGKGEIDILTGGSGADRFVLGSGGALYSDGNRKKAGREDYALITDFSVGEDKLQLSGKADNYFLKSSDIKGISGKGLYFDSNKNGAFDKFDELVAIINSPEKLTFQNTIKTAFFA